MSEVQSGGKGKSHRRATPLDEYIGQRLRERRLLLDLSQTELGMASGITFQQVQKYEQGVNRIRASRLFEEAELLDVPVSYFFEGAPKSSGDHVIAKNVLSSGWRLDI